MAESPSLLDNRMARWPETVNHHSSGTGEFSTGEMGKFSAGVDTTEAKVGDERRPTARRRRTGALSNQAILAGAGHKSQANYEDQGANR